MGSEQAKTCSWCGNETGQPHDKACDERHNGGKRSIVGDTRDAEIERLKSQLSASEEKRKVLGEACRLAQGAMGMHGPCRNNSCADCKLAWKKLREALASDSANALEGA